MPEVNALLVGGPHGGHRIRVADDPHPAPVMNIAPQAVLATRRRRPRPPWWRPSARRSWTRDPWAPIPPLTKLEQRPEVYQHVGRLDDGTHVYRFDVHATWGDSTTDGGMARRAGGSPHG